MLFTAGIAAAALVVSSVPAVASAAAAGLARDVKPASWRNNVMLCADEGRCTSSGNLVKVWQLILASDRSVGASVKDYVDGKFGSATATATEKWQKSHGPDDDGVVGPDTWATAQKQLKEIRKDTRYKYYEYAGSRQTWLDVRLTKSTGKWSAKGGELTKYVSLTGGKSGSSGAQNQAGSGISAQSPRGWNSGWGTRLGNVNCKASFYHEDELVAGNKRFNPDGMTAASWYYPLGTKLRVTNKKSGASVLVEVNDRGPAGFVLDRGTCVDLSLGAFKKITGTNSLKAAMNIGVIKVQYQVIE